MKKIIVTTLALGAGLVMASAASAGTTIVGSAHDFSGATWNNQTGTSGEICVTCHTPHNAQTTVADAPLWNHAVSSATYTLYTSPTLDASPGQPSGVSKLCLACHDGTVALDSFGTVTGSVLLTGPALIGTDLSGHHPVSLTYDDTLAGNDGELHVPSTATTDIGGTIATDLLFSGQLECASCHDVHNRGLAANYLLNIDNTASNFCLTCHDK